MNMNRKRHICFLAAVLAGTVAMARVSGQSSADPSLVEFRIISSIDGTEQSNRAYLPSSSKSKPLLVFLHSWSNGLEQDNTRWLELAKQRGWAFLQPNFRGKNNRPEACGSELARQDILDAMKHVLDKAEIDRSRIYLAGTSGGGHMSMLMASYYPEKFSAASSWVGISDLEKWHAATKLKPATVRYAKEIENCIGGIPGASEAVRYELKMRSPIHHLAKAAGVPLDINTGVRDGHTGSVPVSQSIEAFNVILRANHKPEIPLSEIEKWTAAGEQERVYPDAIDDATYSRKVLFRSQVKDSRLTIFEGAHEDLPAAGVAFLETIRRETRW
jgi:pimeloyl-ACP methyl ester carboxylesterase